MDEDIEVVAAAACIFAYQAFFVGFLDCSLKHRGFMVELAPDVDVSCQAVHRAASNETAFDELVRVFAHDFAVFACPGFAFVGVDDEIAGFGVFVPVFEVHERLFMFRRASMGVGWSYPFHA